MTWRRFWPYVWPYVWPYLLLIAAVFTVYANVYGNQFLYDDEFLILKNQNLRDWSGALNTFFMSSTGGAGGIDSFYRPLQGVLYTIIFQIFGLSTFGFHLLNVLLHAGNSCLIFILGQRLGFRRSASGTAALLWSLHPLHTEAITYQSATADPLHTFFIMLGLIAISTDRTPINGPAKNKLVLASLAYVAALLSKEAAIVFPALAIACRFVSLKPELRCKPKSYLFTIPFWTIAALYLLARQTFLNFDQTFRFFKSANIYSENIVYRLYTFLATLPYYVGLILWPHDLHMDRGFPVYTSIAFWPVWVGALLLLIASLVVFKERIRPAPFWAFASLWFFAAYVPQSGVLIPVNAFFLEHWLYLPSIALFWALGEALIQLRIKPRYQIGLVAILAIPLGSTTWLQNKVWSDPVTFYTNILTFENKTARVENNLAMAYSERGQDVQAIEHYSKAIQISDTYPQTHHNLGLVYLHQAKRQLAIKEFEKALTLNPDFYQAAAELVRIYEADRNFDQTKLNQIRFSRAVDKLRIKQLQ